MEEALGSLVNADMEEETAKLAALQVKQQLASQMLSMANDSQRNILMLFQ
jgi:flagellin